MRKQTFLPHTRHPACIQTVELCKTMIDTPISNHIRRLLLQIPGDGEVNEEGTPELLSPTSPHPIYQQLNGTRQIRNFRQPQRQPPSSFDSSMALTILVLLTALFFMGFFFSLFTSIQLRRGLRRFSTPATHFGSAFESA